MGQAIVPGRLKKLLLQDDISPWIDPQNNHAYLWPRIARLDQRAKFQTVWNPGVRIKPDPYCVVQSLDDWSADDLQSVNH